MQPAPETCWRSIPRQSPGRGKTPPTRMSRPSLTAPHRRAQRHASVRAARPATSSMCASSTPGRCVDHEPPRATVSDRAWACRPRHGLLWPTRRLFWLPQRGCYRSAVSTMHRNRRASHHRATGRRNGLPHAAHHQPQRRPGKSIAANVAPPRSVQPSFCGGYAPQKLLLRSLALVSLDPCLPGSSPRLFRDAHHHGF